MFKTLTKVHIFKKPMFQGRHFKNWPTHLPRKLEPPIKTIFQNLVVSADRFPEKSAIIFYGTTISYRDLLKQTESLASYLRDECYVKKGDRVILDLQSSPQFVIGYYAILALGALVVPISPMNVSDEINHYCTDSGTRTAIVSQDVVKEFKDVLDKNVIDRLIVATYSDYISKDFIGEIPTSIAEEKIAFKIAQVVDWSSTQRGNVNLKNAEINLSDLAAILYTSGTTGRPKGCMHTHETIMRNIAGAVLWEGITSTSVLLTTTPLFHVTGMQHSMNAGVAASGSLVILPRWDPKIAGELIEKHGCTHWANVPTMVVDLLADSTVETRDLSSLQNIFGGGSSMPEAVAQELFDRCGIRYMEAYGMTETISQTHMNPPQDLRKQCLGIPTFDTMATIIDPETLRELGPNEKGEIVSSGPQIMLGYWGREDANKESFIHINGDRFFRTGDLGWYDEDGFFYISDRIKRMINSSGYKIWPAEVEAALYKHPAIKELAIISSPDARRGETVKAMIVLKGAYENSASEKEIIDWSREHMASYKIPRVVEFVSELPRSASGKIQWRLLQEAEWQQQS
ncbi:MAG: long-chain-fatty-acid--CoA ligase [Proteobacteria bacterium]|nr:long-chain-fatty-acid--CoA ligase [Pseudomonadota bacterium]